jgi:hypothetical protein
VQTFTERYMTIEIKREREEIIWKGKTKKLKRE